MPDDENKDEKKDEKKFDLTGKTNKEILEEILRRQDDIDTKYVEMRSFITDKMLPVLNDQTKILKENIRQGILINPPGEGEQQKPGGQQPQERPAPSVNLQNGQGAPDWNRIQEEIAQGGGDPQGGSYILNMLMKIANNIVDRQLAPPPSNAAVYTNSILPLQQKELGDLLIARQKADIGIAEAIVEKIKGKAGEQIAKSIVGEGVFTK